LQAEPDFWGILRAIAGNKHEQKGEENVLCFHDV
jgi:hypothetical protein